MGLTRDEILNCALRYIGKEETTDFPWEGDLFCFVTKKLDPSEKPYGKQKWAFGGYGICEGYTLDEETRPPGKWLWLRYVSLLTFPPHKTALKLQPPHVVKGRFQNQDRSMEIRIVKIDVRRVPGAPEESAEIGTEAEGKILRFPSKRGKSRK
jgi:hypothetical protein